MVFLPKPYKKEPITVRVEECKRERMDRLAQLLGMSRSELVNQCIDYAFEQLPEAAEGEQRDEGYTSQAEGAVGGAAGDERVRGAYGADTV